MAADPGTGLSVGEMVRDHHKRIDELERFRDELHGALYLVKFTLGASVLSGIVSILAIAALLSGQTK